MRKLNLWMLIAVAVMTVGCNIKKDVPTSAEGNVQLLLSTSDYIPTVVTRATEGYALPSELIPAQEDFTLKVEGRYTEVDDAGATVVTQYVWGEDGTKSFDDWAEENPGLEAGEYNLSSYTYQNEYQALVASGNPDEEGQGKAYFVGQSEKFVVSADATKSVAITAHLANSCFTFAVDEWMLNYYKDIEFTITTAAGAEFKFEPTTTDSSALFFVKAGQKLKISGSATKSQNDAEVEFPMSEIGNTLAAETHYAINVTHSKAGGSGLTIIFGDTFTEVDPIEEEMNGDYDSEN